MNCLFIELKSAKTPKKTSNQNKSPLPQKRSCRYYLTLDGKCELLGQTDVPVGIDIDDAFPPFHILAFSHSHYGYLINAIERGGWIIAESDIDGERSALAYTIGDSNQWYGREATLKYFGLIFKPAIIS